MTLHQICEIITGAPVTQSDMERTINHAFASDLMSDVLTLKHTGILLITGLSNIQSIRTAEMADVHCVLMTRNKVVTSEMIELAIEADIAIIRTPMSTYRASGLLYEAGVQPIY